MPFVHLVFDLPLDGPFDYEAPDLPEGESYVGRRAKVSFHGRTLIGYIIGSSNATAIARVKPILKCQDPKAIFDQKDIDLLKEWALRDGISLGEALSSYLNDVKKRDLPPIYPRKNKKRVVHDIVGDDEMTVIEGILSHYQPQRDKILIVAPDMQTVYRYTKKFATMPHIKVATRSSLHISRQAAAMIMLYEEDALYQQEQTPKYNARELAMLCAKHYEIDMHMVSVAPSLEMYERCQRNEWQRIVYHQKPFDRKPMIIDMGNYSQKGLISPAALSICQRALLAGQRVVIVCNRLGHYAQTSCDKCQHIVHCPRCEAAMILNRASGQLHCRYCSQVLSLEKLICGQCGGKVFKSKGVGVLQLLNQMKKLFAPHSVDVFSHEKANQGFPSTDIVLTTSAIWNSISTKAFGVLLFLDVDRDINRAQVQAVFKVWRSIIQARFISQWVLVQTRQVDLPMLKSLAQDARDDFYQSELKIRRDLMVSPFGHWIKISIRSKDEGKAKEAADLLHEQMTVEIKTTLTPIEKDAVSKKRDQFYFYFLVQSQELFLTMPLVRRMIHGHRWGQVIITTQVDP